MKWRRTAAYDTRLPTGPSNEAGTIAMWWSSDPHALARFVADSWEASPATVTFDGGQPLASEEDVFAALLDAAAVFRGERRGPRPAFGIFLELDDAARVQVIGDRVAHYLPRDEDRDLERYLARLLSVTADRRFGIVLGGYPAHHAGQWLRAREFMAGLQSAAGNNLVPAVDIFLGNYRHTPFGVHQDDQSVFTWSVRGRKRFLTWPDSSFASRVDRYTPEQRQAAQILELEPGTGTFAYWPPSHWHIAEGTGEEVSVTVAFGVKPAGDFVGDTLRAHAAHVREKLAASITAPPVFRETGRWNRIAGWNNRWSNPLSVNDEGFLRDDMSARLLAYYSGRGLDPIPPRATPAISADQPIDLQDEPLVWLPQKDTLGWGVNGHVFSTQRSEPMEMLLTRVAAAGGQPVSLSGLTRSMEQALPDCDGAGLIEELLVNLCCHWAATPRAP